MIEVLHPGLQTQLQDSGRWGWQADGVPVGGAMDGWSHRVANLLAGNATDEATLEILLQGPRLRFTHAACIAVVGAELPLTLDGRAVPCGQRLAVPAGAELACGRASAGLRAYLAVQGGLDVAPVLGSRSTYVRGGFGGWQGRALQAGDRLPLGPAGAAWRPIDVAPDTTPTLPDPTQVETVLAVPGEHWDAFPAAVRAAFTATAWRVGPQSDRMGYRLQGPALGAPALGELLSEGVAFGTVQVPPDGQPIVLMAERQSTGGYPKIAHVAAVDLPLLAQMAPGQALRFEIIDTDRAQALLEDRERHLARLRRILLETP